MTSTPPQYSLLILRARSQGHEIQFIAELSLTSGFSGKYHNSQNQLFVFELVYQVTLQRLNRYYQIRTDSCYNLGLSLMLCCLIVALTHYSSWGVLLSSVSCTFLFSLTFLAPTRV